MKYTVQVELQAPENDPVTQVWLREGSALDAVYSVSQLMRHAEDHDFEFGPKTLSITITPIEG